MCLYVSNKIELTAKKDIEVYKVLRKWRGSGNWITAYQYTPVKLNSILKAEPVSKVYHSMGDSLVIKGGVIHALTRVIDISDYYTAFKAVIKAGTRFYVGIGFSQIAAEELYITDTQVTESITTPDMELILRDYSEAILSIPELNNKKA